MNELKLITDTIQKQAGNNVNIINGVGTDSSLGSKLSVTVIATGFDVKEEEVEVVVGIGEDETLDSISNTKQKKHSNLKTLNEDFSQQSMFDFEEDLQVNFTDEEMTDQEELELSVSENTSEEIIEGFNTNEEQNRVVLSLDDEIEEEQEMIVESIEATVEETHEVDFTFNMQQQEENIEEEFVGRDRVKINPNEIEENEIASRKREEKLKNISNILRTPSGLTNLIEEPAFKRNGIDLDDIPHSSETEISNDTLSLEEDNMIQLKQNNSFLHDNVD